MSIKAINRISRNFRILALFSFIDKLQEERKIWDYTIKITEEILSVLILQYDNFDWKKFEQDLDNIIPGFVKVNNHTYEWIWK